MNFDRLDERKIRLTTFPLTLSSYALSPDGEKLYLMARMDKNYDIWTLENRTKELKLLAKLNAESGKFQMSKDGKTIFTISSGRISKVTISDGKVTPINIKGEMALNLATGTAVWWETQVDPTIVFGIPMIATMGKEGRPTENLQINPDIEVDNDYNSVLSGKDLQLERAVAEMLKQIKQ
jgi:hypothetical protein